MQKILESTKFVIENSKFVSINPKKVVEFASNFDHSNVKHWLSAAPFDIKQLNDNEKLNFLLIMDSISFCY